MSSSSSSSNIESEVPFGEVYLPKISSTLSIIGSSVIIAEVIGDAVQTTTTRRRRKRRRPSATASSSSSSSPSSFLYSLTTKTGCMSRILLSMSIGDILFSFGWFFGTWLSPSTSNVHDKDHQNNNIVNNNNNNISDMMMEEEFLDDYSTTTTTSIPLSNTTTTRTNNNDDYPYYGTHGSCTFQGFIVQLGGSLSLFFNASLAVFYFLMVKYHWREGEERFQKVESRLQIGLWTICLIAATLPIFFDMYHNTGPVCWIDADPFGCTQSWQLDDGHEFLDETDCVAGDNATFMVIALQLVPLTVCVIADSVIMIMIYWTVRKLEAPTATTISRNSSSSTMATTRTAESAADQMNKNDSTIDKEEEEEKEDHDRDDHDMCNTTSSADQQAEDSNKNGPSQKHQVDGFVGNSSSSSVILHQEGENEEEEGSSRTTMRRQNKRSAIVARRGILYISGFLLTFGLTFVSAVTFLATGNWYVPLDRSSYFFVAFQGVWNFLVFSKHRDMQTWVGRSLKTITWDYAFGCRLWSISISSISNSTRSNHNPQSQQSLSVLDGQHLGSEGTLLPSIEGNSQQNGYGSNQQNSIVDGDTAFSATDYSSRNCPSLTQSSRNDTPPTRPFRAVSDVESSALDDNSTIMVMGNDQQVPSHHNSTECTAAGGADVREHEKKKISTKSVTFAAALNNFLFFCRDESPRAVGYTNNKRGETSSTGTTTARSRHPFLSMFPQSSGTDEQTKRPPNQPMRFESDTLNDSIGTPTTPTTTPNTPSTTGVDSSLTSSTRQDRSARMPPKLPVRFKSEEDNGPEDDTLNTSKPHHVTRYVANTKPPTRPLRLESETCDEEDSAATSVSRRPRFNLIGRFRNQDETLAPKLPKRIESGEE